MFPEISYEFSARDYKSIFEIPLKEREVAEVILSFIKLLPEYIRVLRWNNTTFWWTDSIIMCLY